MRQQFKQHFIEQGKKMGLVGIGLATFVSQAMAALPAEATAAFTALSGNLTDILGAVWPMVATATGAFVLIKLFKRGAGKI